jgi:thioesterase domain-containing protein
MSISITRELIQEMFLSQPPALTFGRCAAPRRIIAPPVAPPSGGRHTRAIQEVRHGENRPPLFLVHGVGGGMLWGYNNLADYLDGERSIYAIKCRSSRGLPEPATIEEMAADYVAEVNEVYPHGPFHLGGYCFGGNVAFEMARQFRQQGREVGAVVLFNSVPAHCKYDIMQWTPINTLKFIANAAYWAGRFLAWSPKRQLQFFQWKLRSFRRRVAKAVLPDCDFFKADDVVDLAAVSAAEQQTWAAHVAAFNRYYLGPYDRPITLLRTKGHQMYCTFAKDYGWSEFAKAGVSVRILPGEHESILDHPNVEETAAALRTELERHEVMLAHRTGADIKAGQN